MLTELQQLVFHLHSRLFFYMYPIPIKWQDNFGRLSLSMSILEWVPWMIQFLSVLSFGLASIIYPFIYGYFRPKPYLHFDVMHKRLLVATGAVAILVCVIACRTILALRALIASVNEGLEMSSELDQGIFDFFLVNI